MSYGLELAGWDVTGVDINPQPHHRGGVFVQADALTFPLDGFDYIHASPPCQAHSTLRHLQKSKEYPCFINTIRERLQSSGALWSIENVPGAPLGSGGFLTMLCGTMFGLQTPDGRAEIRRHRLFETSFSIALRPACQHGGVGTLSVVGKSPEISARRALTVTGAKGLPGKSLARRVVMSVTGSTPQRNIGHNQAFETFSINDARAAMGIDWMPMRSLSQAIPPTYGKWIGERAMEAFLAQRVPTRR